MDIPGNSQGDFAPWQSEPRGQGTWCLFCMPCMYETGAIKKKKNPDSFGSAVNLKKIFLKVQQCLTDQFFWGQVLVSKNVKTDWELKWGFKVALLYLYLYAQFPTCHYQFLRTLIRMGQWINTANHISKKKLQFILELIESKRYSSTLQTFVLSIACWLFSLNPCFTRLWGERSCT